MSKIHTPKFPMRNWILGRLYDFEDADDMKALSDLIDDCRSREAAFDLTMIAHQLHGIAMGWRDLAIKDDDFVVDENGVLHDTGEVFGPDYDE